MKAVKLRSESIQVLENNHQACIEEGKQKFIYICDNIYVNDRNNEYHYYKDGTLIRLNCKRGCGKSTLLEKINNLEIN